MSSSVADLLGYPYEKAENNLEIGWLVPAGKKRLSRGLKDLWRRQSLAHTADWSQTDVDFGFRQLALAASTLSATLRPATTSEHTSSNVLCNVEAALPLSPFPFPSSPSTYTSSSEPPHRLLPPLSTGCVQTRSAVIGRYIQIPKIQKHLPSDLNL
ncbi:hypothetical protein BDQ12DRAFT_721646 [Crucibulum laeve]|uniref:Uncharacterized protein n=1 Tax=Crucibulum laeve TaxID=68775 RepID=A0A5C3M4I4_9AGAR|nr:hypothetical protein BDQ12DRAFT_721646 [Crucibulum laeve]